MILDLAPMATAKLNKLKDLRNLEWWNIKCIWIEWIKNIVCVYEIEWKA